MMFEKPKPFVPRRLRVEVTERVNYKGNVLVPLDEASVRNAIHELMNQNVESIAVCLLHSYANPTHEKRVFTNSILLLNVCTRLETF